MTSQETVKVFIGSGEASLLERKVLIYSLHKHSTREIDIYIFNGTHNAVEHNQEEPVLAPMPLKIKYRNITEFSYYRFLIPQLCDHQGKAIWLDSDIITLHDIGELFDTPMDGYDLLMKTTAYPDLSPDLDPRCSAIMVIDCERVRFDLESLIREVDQGLYSDRDLMHMTIRFRRFHPFQIGEFAPEWNIRDYWDEQTKLIHYTDLETQPWKYHNHPYGELWFEYLQEAIQAGYVTQRDIDLSLTRAYVRSDLMSGNFAPVQRKLNRAKVMFRKLTASS
ncbi:glycosyltransferase [Leptolyngbya boryana CZ1]|uniref:Glycosyltransferase n=1 Tax=Leptolyngbya boryana CZ1 TaxID=3060204 RepID=A0AA96WQD5_LEPBY|nr:glycosyltransferase [Leptolyngbya boryana]WNZ43986.1 glycosyltransferase [Leptolyngbya boryana CZ1]